MEIPDMFQELAAALSEAGYTKDDHKTTKPFCDSCPKTKVKEAQLAASLQLKFHILTNLMSSVVDNCTTNTEFSYSVLDMILDMVGRYSSNGIMAELSNLESVLAERLDKSDAEESVESISFK